MAREARRLLVADRHVRAAQLEARAPRCWPRNCRPCCRTAAPARRTARRGRGRRETAASTAAGRPGAEHHAAAIVAVGADRRARVVQRQLRRGDGVDAGAIHAAASSSAGPTAPGRSRRSRAASVVRQPVVSKPLTGAMPLRPASSASRNAACDVPNAETTPMPETAHRFAARAVRYHRCDERSNAARTAHARDRGDRRISVVASPPRLSRRRPAPRADRRRSTSCTARGQQANAAMKTLTARFTETTTSSLLTRPLVARGTRRGRAAVAGRPALHGAGSARRPDRRRPDDDVVAWPAALSR